MVLKILFKCFKRMKDWSTSCAGTLKCKPIYNKDALWMTVWQSPSLLLHRHLCSSVTQCKSVWPTNSEAKLYQNVGVWSSERFTAETGKEMDSSYPKPRTPKSFKENWSEGGVWLVVLGRKTWAGMRGGLAERDASWSLNSIPDTPRRAHIYATK